MGGSNDIHDTVEGAFFHSAGWWDGGVQIFESEYLPQSSKGEQFR